MGISTKCAVVCTDTRGNYIDPAYKVIVMPDLDTAEAKVIELARDEAQDYIDSQVADTFTVIIDGDTDEAFTVKEFMNITFDGYIQAMPRSISFQNYEYDCITFAVKDIVE